MRFPQTRQGLFTIKYKQVPYENRYYFVYYGGETEPIAKMPSTLLSLVERLIGDNHIYNTSWYKFLERVDTYDKFLDEAES